MTATPAPRWRTWLWTLLRWGVTIGAVSFVIAQITWQDQLKLSTGRVVFGWQGSDEVGAPILRGNDGQIYALPAVADDSPPPADKAVYSPGFVSLVSQVHLGWYLLAIMIYIPVILLQSVRWQWLLQTHGTDPGLGEAMRLTWIGLLANNIFPGSTGGDLIKGVCIARRTPDKRVEAFMSVLMDRVMGLVGLLILGGMSLVLHSHNDPSMATAARWVGIMLLIVLFSGCMYFSARVRKFLHVEQLINLLPASDKLHRLDQSVYHYRHHLPVFGWCVALSIFLQMWAIISTWMIGVSLGLNIGLVYYFLYLPIIITFAAFFPSIAGLGVMEGAFQQFFGQAGASPAQALALCLLYRLCMLLVSALGGVAAYREFSAHGIPEEAASDGDLELLEEVVESPADGSTADADGADANAPAEPKPATDKEQTNRGGNGLAGDLGRSAATLL